MHETYEEHCRRFDREVELAKRDNPEDDDA